MYIYIHIYIFTTYMHAYMHTNQILLSKRFCGSTVILIHTCSTTRSRPIEHVLVSPLSRLQLVCGHSLYILRVWHGPTYVCEGTHSYVFSMVRVCDKTRFHVWRDAYMYVTWLYVCAQRNPFVCVASLIYVCDMTHPYMCDMAHSSYVCDMALCMSAKVIHSYVWLVETCLIHTCDMTHSYVWHDSVTCEAWHIYETWLIHRRDMTHSYVWNDSFICETWLIHMGDITHSMRDMTQAHARHDLFTRETWRIHVCDMTESYVSHDSFICATWLIHMFDITR